jgi:hypothetical protein
MSEHLLTESHTLFGSTPELHRYFFESKYNELLTWKKMIYKNGDKNFHNLIFRGFLSAATAVKLCCCGWLDVYPEVALKKLSLMFQQGVLR